MHGEEKDYEGTSRGYGNGSEDRCSIIGNWSDSKCAGNTDDSRSGNIRECHQRHDLQSHCIGDFFDNLQEVSKCRDCEPTETTVLGYPQFSDFVSDDNPSGTCGVLSMEEGKNIPTIRSDCTAHRGHYDNSDGVLSITLGLDRMLLGDQILGKSRGIVGGFIEGKGDNISKYFLKLIHTFREQKNIDEYDIIGK